MKIIMTAHDNIYSTLSESNWIKEWRQNSENIEKGNKNIKYYTQLLKGVVSGQLKISLVIPLRLSDTNILNFSAFTLTLAYFALVKEAAKKSFLMAVPLRP